MFSDMTTEQFFLLLTFVGATFFIVSFALGEVFHGVDGFLGGIAHELHFGEGNIDDDESISPFSIRTILIFLTFFGGIGYVCFNAGLTSYVALAISTIAGILAAWVVYMVLKYLASQSGTAHWKANDTIGNEADVSVSIKPGSVGEVSFLMRGQHVSYLARSNETTVIPNGSRVRIVDAKEGELIVEPISA